MHVIMCADVILCSIDEHALSLTLLVVIRAARHQRAHGWKSDAGHGSDGPGRPHHPIINKHTVPHTNHSTAHSALQPMDSHHASEPKPYQASWNNWNPSPSSTVRLFPILFISTLNSNVCTDRESWRMQSSGACDRRWHDEAQWAEHKRVILISNERPSKWCTMCWKELRLIITI